MRNLAYKIFILFLVISIFGCKKENKTANELIIQSENIIKHAKGLEIYKYNNYSVVKVINPWPGAGKSYTYVLHKKNAVVPDSLKKYTTLQVPVRSIITTSTTHIPSLEMLGVENTLAGFPNTNYVSSEKTRNLIDSGKVKEVGMNENLNTETIIDLSPDVVVAISINSTNNTLNNLEQNGVKILYNGDWTEQAPLGKAEWIKLFGALYDMDDKANILFNDIEKNYNNALVIAKKAKSAPTVLSGALYQEQWYLPQGNSWAALFFRDAKSNYLWKESEGTGSLSLSFETVLDKAQDADFWIGPAQFTSLKEMTDTNTHYSQFKSFQSKNVYSSSTKKGKTGGVIYYELAPNRPDLILKDMIKILHPELLPEYELTFFEKLK